MNEKPVKLPMAFGEALLRLARTPKVAVKRLERRRKAAAVKSHETGTSKRRPRSGRRKTA